MLQLLSDQLDDLYKSCSVILGPIPCSKELQGQKLSDLKLKTEEVNAMIFMLRPSRGLPHA
ncbi:hypothetical protein EJ06DRAFT_529972 [Trichodelitschia bisporula]|uniref:Uncharacterized protein n=1 Tax=Trichodelitschia bisporula TaxID=703511 RepID=A0A6G1HYG2_9PEZI|nr:hypothetical protein EJ06DRAFT_529972 [Trichodelitschia bisporula]